MINQEEDPDFDVPLARSADSPTIGPSNAAHDTLSSQHGQSGAAAMDNWASFEAYLARMREQGMPPPPFFPQSGFSPLMCPRHHFPDTWTSL